MSMKQLSAADIVAADDLVVREVKVPEWGGTVLVRSLTGEDRASYLASIVTTGPDGKLVPQVGRADLQLAYLSLINPDGSRMFTDRAGFEALAGKSNRALKRITDVAEEISGLGKDAVEAAEGN